ncbi:MAG: STAS domain-containing protein, partial [Anaerolineales bacterium]|nr:STAS domain-containing protein [Anaerolineales bacterium]
MSVWHQEINNAAGIWLVGARGRLDQGLNPQLESTLLQLFADGHYVLIVDLEETTYINSGGLR